MTRGAAQAQRLCLGLSFFFGAIVPAAANGPVYKEPPVAGAASTAVYSDRPARAGAKPIPNRASPTPGAANYEAAVIRAESERLSLQRSQLENRAPRKIVIYDPPRGGIQPPPASGRTQDSYAGSSRRWDPNLPASPAPSLDRNYNYNGR